MGRIVDLSYPIEPHWRPSWLNERKVHSTFDKGSWHTSIVTLSCHGFTHVDAPLHRFPGGKTLDQVPLETFIGTAYIVDLSDVAPNTPITAEMVAAKGGHIRPGGIVVLKTLWDQRASHKEKAFWTTAPFTTQSAAEWILKQHPKAVAFDFPPAFCFRYAHMDPEERARHTDRYAPHETFLPHGISTIEYVCNLGRLTRDTVQFFALAPNVVGVEGFPARVIAIEE
jgi:kynurenine formamidase